MSSIVYGRGTLLCAALVLAGCDLQDSAPRKTIASALAAPVLPTPSSPVSRTFNLLSPEAPRKESEDNQPAGATPSFQDVAQGLNLHHTYDNGPAELLLMVQPTGGGCGWIDYDRDGLWDIYLNQGGNPSLPASPDQPSDQLFRNLGTSGFANVTVGARIEERDFSQGVAVGDFDNDGFEDVFVTNAGTDTLLHNQGDGTFADITEQLNPLKGFSSSAAWGDIDRDGDLDLYVCRYVDFDRFQPKICQTTKGVHKMCQPNDVDPVPDECYLNEGDGGFRRVAEQRGLSGPGNKALGVAIADFDNDDWPDIYVANDATANFLFINRHDGHFDNQADVLGCAVSSEGRAQASMGVAVGDFDHNQYLDLYLTHFEGEWNTLYRNLGPQGFSDVTAAYGGVEPTLPFVGFGTVMEDFNHDGREDVLVANGHLDDPGHVGVELAMVPLMFTFGDRRLLNCSDAAGDYFRIRQIGRGVATADFDDDGDLDVAIVHQNTPVALLQNSARHGNFLKLEFIGRHSNRRGIGTRVTIRLGKERLMRELAGGTSYCVANQPTLVFGLGPWSDPVDLEIRWPNGNHQHLEGISVNQKLVLTEPDPVPINGMSSK